MTFDDLSLKQADSVLQELHSRFDSGDIELSAIEAAVLILDHIISNFQESYYRLHLEKIGPQLTSYLESGKIGLFSYDKLGALSRVLNRIKEIMPEGAAHNLDERIESANEGLAKQDFNADSCPEPGTLYISVTHQPLRSLQSLNVGKLLRAELRVELTGEWSLFHRRKSVIAFDGKILESTGPFAQQLRNATAVAESIFICTNGQKELAKLPRQYMFGLTGLDDYSSKARAFTGGSAGLGFALLTLHQLEKLGFRRRQRRLREKIAVTGQVAADGSVMSVDDEGMKAKLRSVFFSSCSHFVIPDGNLAISRAALEELCEEFPQRKLELVPVSSVANAYYDDRIFDSYLELAGSIAFKKINRKRKYIVAGLSLIVAVVAIMILVPMMFIKDISSFYVENDVLHFVNRFGVVFDRFEPGYHIFKCENQDPGSPPGLIRHGEDSPPVYAYNGFYEDVTADGKKEFVFVAVEVEMTEKTPVGRVHVHLLDHSRGQVLHIPLSDTLRMLEEGKLVEHTKVNLTWNGLHDFDHDGRKELYVVVRNHIFSPMAIQCISFDKQSVQTFAHYGYCNALRILDYNKDGRDEIILAGVHGDPLDKAILFVLDPIDMQGTTPIGLDPSFIDFKDDEALLYIMFPQTIMCELLRGECSRPHAMTINPQGDGTIWCGVKEGNTGLMYYFDSSWRCTRIVFIDTYQSRYKAFQKIHDLKPMNDYKEDLRAEVKYWGGENWVASPP